MPGATANPGRVYDIISIVLFLLWLCWLLLIASVDPENIKSIKLLNKLEMRIEAYFVKSIKMNEVWLDDCIYAIRYDEWKMGKKN